MNYGSEVNFDSVSTEGSLDNGVSPREAYICREGVHYMPPPVRNEGQERWITAIARGGTASRIIHSRTSHSLFTLA